jgi:hypothetical protein
MLGERGSLDSRFTLLACSTIGMTPTGEAGKRLFPCFPEFAGTGNAAVEGQGAGEYTLDGVRPEENARRDGRLPWAGI